MGARGEVLWRGVVGGMRAACGRRGAKHARVHVRVLGATSCVRAREELVGRCMGGRQAKVNVGRCNIGCVLGSRRAVRWTGRCLARFPPACECDARRTARHRGDQKRA